MFRRRNVKYVYDLYLGAVKLLARWLVQMGLRCPTLCQLEGAAPGYCDLLFSASLRSTDNPYQTQICISHCSDPPQN